MLAPRVYHADNAHDTCAHTPTHQEHMHSSNTQLDAEGHAHAHSLPRSQCARRAGRCGNYEEPV